MSVSTLGSLTAGSSLTALPARGSGFAPQLALLGRGRTGEAHRPLEAGTPGDATSAGDNATRSLAADTRALVGDVFGALGADTSTATTARQAAEAYRRAG